MSEISVNDEEDKQNEEVVVIPQYIISIKNSALHIASLICKFHKK